MATTSINFRPVKGGSEQHNHRQKKLSYVRTDLTKFNENWQSDNQANRLAMLKQLIKAKTGRSMQAKATPLREAVVVIKEDTTMADLQNLSRRMREEFGIDVFQISIHRDEGHEADGKFKHNWHAHLVADWVNHDTGKSWKLNPTDTSRMQDITAEVLHMDRGKSNHHAHLEAVEFKIKKAKEELESLKNQQKAVKKALQVILSRRDEELATEAKKVRQKAISDILTAANITMDNPTIENVAELIRDAEFEKVTVQNLRNKCNLQEKKIEELQEELDEYQDDEELEQRSGLRF